MKVESALFELQQIFLLAFSSSPPHPLPFTKVDLKGEIDTRLLLRSLKSLKPLLQEARTI